MEYSIPMGGGRSPTCYSKAEPIWPNSLFLDGKNALMTFDEDARPIDPQVRIGHVHLKVADLERSLRFYCGVLGFQITQRYGTQAAFVSAGGYHHHIGLNTLGEPGRVVT